MTGWCDPVPLEERYRAEVAPTVLRPTMATSHRLVVAVLLSCAVWERVYCHLPPDAGVVSAMQGQLDSLQSQLNVLQSQLNTLKSSAGECPPGWSRLDHSCYLIPSLTASWLEAGLACAVFDPRARLASVHQGSSALIAGLVASSDTEMAWIGLHRPTGTTDWLWTDGSAVDFINWHPPNPSNTQSNEKCTEMRTYEGVQGIGGWNDRDCTVAINFVCQINL